MLVSMLANDGPDPQKWEPNMNTFNAFIRRKGLRELSPKMAHMLIAIKGNGLRNMVTM